MIGRRPLLLGLSALALPRIALAGPSAQERKLANRLELWGNYARRTRNLMARLGTRRETSLLEEPLLSTGTLVFRAPDLLVLREDGRQGSTTLIDGASIRLFLNGAGQHDPAAIDADQRPAARWLAQRLVRLFAPGDGTALLEETRPNVPKGRGYRLELLPPRGSTTRRQIRSLGVQFDPVAGSITQITIAEAQGDRVVMSLSDTRQNLPDEDIDAFLAQLDP
ncbi:MAG: outer membrane lipoprotein carrier protein LolA [Myxococcota bacterium]